MDQADNIIEISALEKSYGSGRSRINVLKGIDLAVSKVWLFCDRPSGTGNQLFLIL
jgi:predicted ABC-type transport system involved in lysophospholipase L1 biosynthesis ATPase subunit